MLLPVLDDGWLVVAHAAMREDTAGRSWTSVRSFALHGDMTGGTDENGPPVRYRWARDCRGWAAVVYGHTPDPDAVRLNMHNTIGIRTGGVLGGELTALRSPPSRRAGSPPGLPQDR